MPESAPIIGRKVLCERQGKKYAAKVTESRAIKGKRREFEHFVIYNAKIRNRKEWVPEARITWIEDPVVDSDETVDEDQTLVQCPSSISQSIQPASQSIEPIKDEPEPESVQPVTAKKGRAAKSKAASAKQAQSIITPDVDVFIPPDSLLLRSPVTRSFKSTNHIDVNQLSTKLTPLSSDVPVQSGKRTTKSPFTTPISAKIHPLTPQITAEHLELPTPAKLSVKPSVTQSAKSAKTPKRKLVDVEAATEPEPAAVKRPRGRPRKCHLPVPEPVVECEDDDEDEDDEQNVIEHLRYGNWEFSSLYFSPYPREYRTSTLYVCDRCLKYTRGARKMYNHRVRECRHTQPPGLRIYHDEQLGLSVYEVDGGANPTSQLYAQNLCLLGKCFINTKTVYFHVKPFIFYVLTLTDTIQLPVDDQMHDDTSSHLVDHSINPPLPAIKCDTMIGYFSKDKILYTEETQNLACLLTSPHQQGRGFGRFLVALSFELTRRQSLTGKPESPLSESARITYEAYWKDTLTDAIIKACENDKQPFTFCPIRSLAAVTGIDRADVIATISRLGFVTETNENDQVGINVTSSVCERLIKQTNTSKLQRQQRCEQKKLHAVEFQPHLLLWPTPSPGKARSRSHTPSSSPNLRLPYGPLTRSSSPRPTLEQVDENGEFNFIESPKSRFEGSTMN